MNRTVDGTMDDPPGEEFLAHVEEDIVKPQENLKGIMQNLEKVAECFPDYDRNILYSRLGRHQEKEDPVAYVIKELNVEKKLAKTNTKTNELEKEASILVRSFPHVPPHKIYEALVETFEKRNRKRIVYNLFLNSQGKDTAAKAKREKFRKHIQRDVGYLEEVFPDADSGFLYREVLKNKSHRDRLERIIAKLTQPGYKYPTIRDMLEKVVEANRTRLQSLNMTFQEFFAGCPDAMEIFYDNSRSVSLNYKEHCKIYVHIVFQAAGSVNSTLMSNKYLLTPIVKHMKKRGFMHLSDQQALPKLPEVPDELFYMELFFLKNEQNITDYHSQKELSRKDRFKKCEEEGTLEECHCCYDNVLPEDMHQCQAGGHSYCRDCIELSSKVAIGDGNGIVRCLSGDCNSQYSLPVLQTLLNPKHLSALLNNLQHQELLAADIPDLKLCPFCPFATIIPEGHPATELQCLNPQCMKETCLKCRKISHHPKPCEKEVDRRQQYIDEKKSEGLLIICWKCKVEFYKEEGCNMMTCTCGAKTCYVCRTPIQDYSHFGDPREGRCPTSSNTNELNEKNVRKAEEAARASYKETDRLSSVRASRIYHPSTSKPSRESEEKPKSRFCTVM